MVFCKTTDFFEVVEREKISYLKPQVGRSHYSSKISVSVVDNQTGDV